MTGPDLVQIVDELADVFDSPRPGDLADWAVLRTFSTDDARTAAGTLRAEQMLMPTPDQFLAACQAARTARLDALADESRRIPDSSHVAAGLDGIAAAREAMRQARGHE